MAELAAGLYECNQLPRIIDIIDRELAEELVVELFNVINSPGCINDTFADKPGQVKVFAEEFPVNETVLTATVLPRQNRSGPSEGIESSLRYGIRKLLLLCVLERKGHVCDAFKQDSEALVVP